MSRMGGPIWSLIGITYARDLLAFELEPASSVFMVLLFASFSVVALDYPIAGIIIMKKKRER